MSEEIRFPAVAGMFYPADPGELLRQVEGSAVPIVVVLNWFEELKRLVPLH